jgi:hypothetical protein
MLFNKTFLTYQKRKVQDVFIFGPSVYFFMMKVGTNIGILT